jgi:hypothetical protein
MTPWCKVHGGAKVLDVGPLRNLPELLLLVILEVHARKDLMTPRSSSVTSLLMASTPLWCIDTVSRDCDVVDVGHQNDEARSRAPVKKRACCSG